MTRSRVRLTRPGTVADTAAPVVRRAAVLPALARSSTPAFASDLSRLPLHTDMRAASSVHADAYMVGSGIAANDRGVPMLRRQGIGDLRRAEAAAEDQNQIGGSPIDAEFWILPPRLPVDVVPVVDDEESGVVVGYRTRGSVTFTYDLEGTVVSVDEPGVESPLIDPIDLLAGGFTGLFRGAARGAVGGGGRAAAREVAGVAGRRGGALIVRAGMSALSRLPRGVATALRGVYRAIRFRGPLNFTATTARHMTEAGRRVPHHILKLAIRFGTRVRDPEGVAGAFRYSIQMLRNRQAYTLEVVVREVDQTVLHFVYR